MRLSTESRLGTEFRGDIIPGQMKGGYAKGPIQAEKFSSSAINFSISAGYSKAPLWFNCEDSGGRSAV